MNKIKFSAILMTLSLLTSQPLWSGNITISADWKFKPGDNTEWSKEKWDEFNSPTPIDSLLFKKVPALKDNLKQVAQMLSKRFEDDKDYPEWQKWVNKIFPAGQTPKSEEGNK